MEVRGTTCRCSLFRYPILSRRTNGSASPISFDVLAVSVSSNIAEGSGRVSDVDFARFLEIRIWLTDGSGIAIDDCRRARFSQKRILRRALSRIRTNSARMLSGLRKALITKSHSEPCTHGVRQSFWLLTLDSLLLTLRCLNFSAIRSHLGNGHSSPSCHRRSLRCTS